MLVVERDPDVGAGECRNVAPVSPVGVGHLADRRRNLRDVRHDVVLALPVAVLADEGHVGGRFRQHRLAPLTHRSHGDQLNLGIGSPHGADDRLATAHSETPNGCGWPLRARSFPIGVETVEVEVEDLNLESEAYYTSVGTTYLAANIFDGGTTHFREAGAVEMATLIVKEISKNNGPLAAYLK
ncbi:MAG TPA: hypothetical protein VI456_12415 [Polyangia bacterium]